MTEQNRSQEQSHERMELAGAARRPSRHPVSGLYTRWRREELRLDVDREYPQMVASGTIRQGITSRIHWIANLTEKGFNSWTGGVWYKDGPTASFPYTTVQINVTTSRLSSRRRARVTFSGGSGFSRVRTFRFSSPYFHPVNFEFDFATGTTPTTSVDTCAHPNRPDTLPCENLTLEKVYRRAGFNVTTSPGGEVPIAGAGRDTRWSDLEMHDAMQTYWSHFGSTARWALWVFFASLHERGRRLGGIMFDDIGSNHRQGTAIFTDAFVKNPPAGDPAPAAWVQRMIFWTACHEMGHAFNLAHSWQKSLGPSWIPLANEVEERSFMNYPFRVSGGQTNFFADFEYRFSDSELLFMRHAPARFVQMGNADWFDDHAFEQANTSPEPTFRLELRVNRGQAIFEFMEGVSLELKLTNISSQPQLIDEDLLSLSDTMTVILKKDGKPARQFASYARQCPLPNQKVLMPGEKVYESLPVSSGLNGWDMAEPGKYTLQVALHLDNEDVVSNQLRIRVAPPHGYDEEYLAQDYFSGDVGRIMFFNGSQFFDQGNNILREVTAKLSERRVALQASLALGNVLTGQHKQLAINPDDPQQLGVKTLSAKPEEARQFLTTALTTRATTAVDTFGHIAFKGHVDRLSDFLAQQGAVDEAIKSQDQLYKTLEAKNVTKSKTLGRILQDIRKRRDSYKT